MDITRLTARTGAEGDVRAVAFIKIHNDRKVCFDFSDHTENDAIA
jgi:hypothetical protein